MRRLLLAGASLLAATPALADGTITVAIDHTKDILIYERVGVSKFVFADAQILINADKFAESFALINQSNFRNKACTNCAEKQDYIFDSFNSNQGLMSVNQASGNQNNQGSATSIAYDFSGTVPPPPPPPTGGPRVRAGFAESQAAVEQKNGVLPVSRSEFPAPPVGANGQPRGDLVRNAVGRGFDINNSADVLRSDSANGNRVETANVLFRNAAVENSFLNNSGIIHGNQSAGTMNNQANALSLAVSLADNGVALSEADLGQFNMWNAVGESDSGNQNVGINKLARIGGSSGSFNGNTGVIGFNQSVGNLANQANVVSLSSVGRPGRTTGGL